MRVSCKKTNIKNNVFCMLKVIEDCFKGVESGSSSHKSGSGSAPKCRPQHCGFLHGLFV
jgi:hypothetical protein